MKRKKADKWDSGRVRAKKERGGLVSEMAREEGVSEWVSEIKVIDRVNKVAPLTFLASQQPSPPLLQPNEHNL